MSQHIKKNAETSQKIFIQAMITNALYHGENSTFFTFKIRVNLNAREPLNSSKMFLLNHMLQDKHKKLILFTAIVCSAVTALPCRPYFIMSLRFSRPLKNSLNLVHAVALAAALLSNVDFILSLHSLHRMS